MAALSTEHFSRDHTVIGAPIASNARAMYAVRFAHAVDAHDGSTIPADVTTDGTSGDA